MCTNSTEGIPNNKEAKNSSRGSREIFSRLSCFYRLYTNSRFLDLSIKEDSRAYYSGKKKRHTAVKNQIMVNNRGYIIHKANHKKGKRHDYDVYKRNHPVTPKQVVNVIDLGYLGV